MRALVKNILPYGLVNALKRRRNDAQTADEKRRIADSQARLIAHHFESHDVRKLHLGCGYRPINGWLNADLVPRRDDVVPLDVTQRFPFEDDCFDFIFSEHMIEHIGFADGQKMLRECFRVLKPCGTIRIATPNLATLVSLYTQQKTDAQLRYIQFSVDRYLRDIGIYRDSFVINNFFRNFGHQFIYDPPTLGDALRRTGFTNIVERNVGESDDESLRGIEQHGQDITDEFNRLETFVLEASKPAK
jgi:predicted SAM-dependent methyltransferase